MQSMEIPAKYVFGLVILMILTAAIIFFLSLNDNSLIAWYARLMTIMLLILSGYIINLYHRYQEIVIDAYTEIEIARFESEGIQGILDPTEKTRVIPVNTQNRVIQSGQIQLTNHLVMPKQQLVDFVTESTNGFGLAISKWKSERGWDQKQLERLLDYMGELNLVTKRTNGVACIYTDAYRPEEVLKAISENAMYVS